uniref:CW-type domain-containing protein n=1 Tax=Strigamia maritima TaxID=126957 RepID=T1J2T3_STRMM
MKVSIQAKKVQAYRLVYDLYKPRMYKYTSARFKTRSKDDAKKAELEYKTAKQKLVEAEGRARELENSSLGGAMNRNDRIKLRNLQKTADDLKAEVAQKELKSEVKQKSLKEPKTLSFIFGINLENRKNDGLFIYNCNRLIKMYVRVGPQLEGGQKCRGVVGIVNVPYVVLEPTLNKQDFTDAKEYRHLLKTLGEHMEQYWRDVDFGLRSVTEFWENYGYRTSGWEEMPSMESNFVNRRAREKKICLQCDICLNWRVLPFSSSHVGKVFPDNWVCSLNPDASRNRCTCPEEKLVLPEGKYQKIEKSKDEKDAEAAEAIKRIEDKRSKLYQREVVTSTRSAKNTMEVVAQRRVEPVSKRASASEDTSPVKRKRVNKNRASTESSYDDDVYVPSRALRRRAVRSSWESPAAESNHSSESNVTSIDDLWPELSESEFEVPTTIEIFSRVEVEVQNKWHVGTVVRRTGSDFIVRLDRLPFAKYERRISTNSDKIRLSVSRQSIKVQQEMPSSSTACSVPNHNADDVLEDMSKGFKTCLHYFMPPNWEMTKEKIQNLSVDELLSFPLDDFFSKYEDGLRNLIAGFQDKAEAKSLEAEAANREAEAAKAKLNHTNRLIARLLNSIHDECNLDPDTDSDKVDELLQACVAQAEMPSGQMDQVTTSCL